jgi:hypothetical protein
MGTHGHEEEAGRGNAGLPGPSQTKRMVIVSVRRQAADFEQLEPEGLDLGQHAVQGGLVRQRSRQHSVLSARLTPQGGNAKPIISPKWPRRQISYCRGCGPLCAPVTSSLVTSEHGRRQYERPTHDSDNS